MIVILVAANEQIFRHDLDRRLSVVYLELFYLILPAVPQAGPAVHHEQRLVCTRIDVDISCKPVRKYFRGICGCSERYATYRSEFASFLE